MSFSDDKLKCALVAQAAEMWFLINEHPELCALAILNEVELANRGRHNLQLRSAVMEAVQQCVTPNPGKS